MEGVKDLVARDCGSSNPLMKLASHFTQDRAYHQEAFASPQLQLDDALTEEYLAADPHYRHKLAPSTFSMEALLREVGDVTDVNAPLTHEVDPVTASQNWADELHVQQRVAGEKWTEEFLQGPDFGYADKDFLPLYNSSIWESEFLDDGFAEHEQAWNDSLTQGDMSSAAKNLVDSISDPKIANSSFMKFVKGLSEGKTQLNEGVDGSVIVGEDIAISSNFDDSFLEEFLRPTDITATQQSQQWVNEFLQMGDNNSVVTDTDLDYESSTLSSGPSYVPASTDWFAQTQLNQTSMHPELDTAPVMDDQASSSLSREGEKAWEDQFWRRLQQTWTDVGLADPIAQSDPAEYCKDYQFEVDNPMLDQSDPFSMGLDRLKQGDIPTAVLLFEAAVQKSPTSAKAWQYLGTTHAGNEQEQQAIAALRKCIELEPTNLPARLSLAVSYVNEQLFQLACEALNEWLRYHPRYGHLVPPADDDKFLLPLVSSMMSDVYHEAVRDRFLRAVQTDPQRIDPEVQIGLGVLLFMSRDDDKAIDCFNAALQLDPDNPAIWNKLGASLASLSRHEEAVSAYRHALNLCPGYIRTRYNLGLACAHMDAHKEAVGHYLAALKLQEASGPLAGRASRKGDVTSESLWRAMLAAAQSLGDEESVVACLSHDLNHLVNKYPSDLNSGAHS